MVFPEECGWIRDQKTGRLYFYLPAQALEDLELLETLLEHLQDLDPRETLEEDLVN